MSDNYERNMRALEEATRARDDEIVALRRFLADRVSDERVSVALLASLPQPTPAEEMRARRRFTRDTWPKRRMMWVFGLGAASGGGLAVALAAIVLAALLWRPGEDRDAPLSLTLAEVEASATPTAISRDVRLTASGSGTVGGTISAPVIAWTQGTLSVDVTPGRGVALSVETREATVRVVGTAFDVRRDALGTRVDVAHGRVEVACAAGGRSLLTAGETITCRPTTAAGLLGRANTLKTAGSAPSEVLEAVALGLPMASGPFRAELLALKAEMSLADGDPKGALEAAREYLTLGGARRVEVLQMAASAAMQVEGCAGALPLLQSLEDLGAGDPEALARCEEAP